MTIFPAVAKLLHHFTPHQHNILQSCWKGEQGGGEEGGGGGTRGEGTRGQGGRRGREEGKGMKG